MVCRSLNKSVWVYMTVIVSHGSSCLMFDRQKTRTTTKHFHNPYKSMSKRNTLHQFGVGKRKTPFGDPNAVLLFTNRHFGCLPHLTQQIELISLVETARLELAVKCGCLLIF